MSFFKKIGSLVGLSGSGDAGRRAAGQLADIGADLRNFTPLRVRSAVGTGTFDKEGLNFDLDPRLAAGTSSGLDFFGNTMRKLAEFDEGDATARTLSLLRQRRAEQFDPTLSRLQSRLLQQGRLGFGAGPRGANPEMAAFFGGEAMADLEAQIAAMEETRREREGLMGAAGGGLQLAMESGMPSQMMNGLFSAEQLRAARDMAGAKIAAGGPELAYKGAEADRGARASFFGNIVGGVLGRR